MTGLTALTPPRRPPTKAQTAPEVRRPPADGVIASFDCPANGEKLSASCSRDGRRVAVSGGQRVAVWDCLLDDSAGEPAPVMRFDHRPEPITCVMLSPDGRTAVRQLR